MKQAVLNLFITLLLLGCSTLGKPNVKVTPYTDQFFQPTTKIDVFKLKPPEQAYIEIAELSIRIKKSTSDQGVLHLNEKAKMLGADAIILLGERTEGSISSPGTSPAFSPIYDFPKKKLFAVAIKYRSTIANAPRPSKPVKGKARRFKPISQFTGKVVAISDGDIIKVMFSGDPAKVRLAEIDCPERMQAYGKAAKQFTTDMVFGKVVTVSVKHVDRFGTMVAEVILKDGKSLNRELVRAGLAWWDRNNSEDTSLAIVERKARVKKLGLWEDPNPVPPWALLNP